MADLKLNIEVGYSGKGLEDMMKGIRQLRNVMKDLVPPTMVGKRTVYGQMAADVRSLGNASEKANKQVTGFAMAMRTLDMNDLRRTMTSLASTSANVTVATGRIIAAQRSLQATLNDSTRDYKAATAAAKAFSAADVASVKAAAAMKRATTGAEALAFRKSDAGVKNDFAAERIALAQRKQAYKEEQDALKASARAQRDNARQAQQFAQQMVKAFQSVINIVRQLASIIRSTLTSAIRAAGTAISSFATSAASRFASLRAQLDATGKSFLRMGDNSRRANGEIGQLLSGDALIRTGRNLTQFVNQGSMLLRQTYSQFAEVERSISRAAVAGIEVEDGKVSRGINMDEMWDFVYRTQRGEYGNEPIRSQTTQQLADSIYYLTSAIGVGPTDEASSSAIANMVGPMSIWASATQTDPESFIKGVLGIGQQFGFNPRDFNDPSTAQAFSGISGMVGYLSNVSSMEPTDVIAAMRMVGPSAFNAYGGNDLAKDDPSIRERAMFDTFLGMFAASETGLRGSQVGRGYQRLFSGFADATPKTRGLVANAAGFEDTSENYKDWLYNDQGVMDFGGNGQGILGIANFLRDFKSANGLEAFNDLIYGLFTENATRAMASTIAGMDSTMYKTIEEALSTGNFDLAYQLLAEVMQQETALVSNAVTNMQNAWGQFANSIFRTSNDMIIGGLDAIANIFREISDVIMDFPALGKVLATTFSGLMVGGGLIGGIMVLAGTIVSLNKAFGLLHISAGIVGKAFVMLPFMLMRMVPILFLIGAAVVALKTAWDNNFLGMRDTLTGLFDTFGKGDFSGMLLNFMGTEKFEQIYTWVMRLKNAFTELVSGILFNTGGTNNLGALLYTIFGQNLGGFFYENLLRARTALSAFRTEIKGLFSDIGGGALGNIKDFANLLVGFMDIIFTGTIGARGAAASEAIGELLGIEGFSGIFQAWAQEQRGNFIAALQVVFGVGGAVRGIMGNIGDNLSEIFTFDNLMTALNAVVALIGGFVQGIGIAFLSALKAVEAFTTALTKMGSVGRFLADMTRDLTGLDMSLNGIARTVGVIAGLFVGARFVAPILLFSTALQKGAVYLAGFGVGLAGLAFQGLAALAALGPLGIVLAAVVVSLGLAMAGMIAFTAYTGGMEAVVTGLTNAWNAFKDVMVANAVGIFEFGRSLVQVAMDVAGISSGLLSFESVGHAIGQAISAIAYAAVGAVGGIMVFGAALFRIGKEYGPAVINAIKEIGPIALGIGAAFVAGIAGAVGAFVELSELIHSFGAGAYAAIAALATVWIVLVSPISGVLIAIALVGLAFLAISGDAETMAGTVAGIVANLPAPWQDAADTIIMAFAKVFDFIQQGTGGLIKMGVLSALGMDTGGYSYDPQDSYELQYLYSRGELTPQHILEWQGKNAPLVGAETYGYSWEQAHGENIKSDGVYESNKYGDSRQFTYAGLMDYYDRYGVILSTPEAFYGAYGRYMPEGMGKLPEDNFQYVLSDFSQANAEFEATQRNLQTFQTSPNATALEAIEGKDGIWYVAVGTQPLSEVVGGGYDFANMPVPAPSTGVTGVGSGGTRTAPNMDPYAYWTNALGVPIKSDADLQKHLTSSSNLDIPQFDAIEGLDLPEEWKNYQKQKEDYENFMSMVDSTGVNEATRLWQQFEGGPPPTAPAGSYAQHLLDIAAEGEEGADAIAEAAAKIAEASAALTDAMMQVTDPFQATSSRFDWKQGNGKAGGSGATFLNNQWEAISAAVGDSEWFNQTEMLADAAILGLLDDNMYGVNTHEALMPLWERISAENGVAVETLIADIPKWFSHPSVKAAASAEIFENLNALPTELGQKLDHFGIAEGWTQFGIDWMDVIDFAASKEMKNQSWDFVDYLMESLGMTEEQANAILAQYDIDASAISDEWTAETEMLALSISKGINVMSEEQFKAAETLMEGMDQYHKTIKMSREDFENMDPWVAQYLASLGITIVIEEPKLVGSPNDMGAKARDKVKELFTQGLAPQTPIETPAPSITLSDGKDHERTPEERTKAATLVSPMPLVTGPMNEQDPSNLPQMNPRVVTVSRPVNTVIEEKPGTTEVKPVPTTAPRTGIGFTDENDPRNMPQVGGPVVPEPVPPRTERKTRTVNSEVTEEQGTVTVNALDPSVWDSLLDNAVAQGINAALGNTGVTRTERTRTETVKVNLEIDFEGTMSGSMEGAAQAMAAQFVATFATTVNEQLPVTLSSAVSSALAGMVLGGEEGGMAPINIPIQLDTANVLGQLMNLQMNLLLFTATTYTITLLGDNVPVIAVLDATRLNAQALADTIYTVTINGNNEGAMSAIQTAQDSVNGLVDSEYAVIINATDNASSVITTVAGAIAALNGATATVVINSVGGNIPGRATGGIVRENMTLVGEEGPELVKLPWGSKVYPYQESMQMLNKFSSDDVTNRGHVEIADRQVVLPVLDARGHGSQSNDPQPIQITFGDVTINGDQDIDELAEKIDAALSKKWGMASRGQVSVDYRTYDD